MCNGGSKHLQPLVYFAQLGSLFIYFGFQNFVGVFNKTLSTYLLYFKAYQLR